jgi:hypothetical protein
MSVLVSRPPLALGVSVGSAQAQTGGLATRSWTNNLRAGVSVGVLALLLPSMAFGQAVPAECTPNPATASTTVTCVATAPTVIDGISTTVDDLTVVVGDATTPTTVENAAGDGVSMSGDGSLSLTITNAGSSVSGSDDGVYMAVDGGAGNLTITSEGEIYGGASGIYAANSGTGALSLDVVDVTGDSQDGVLAVNAPFGTDLTITSSGLVSGADSGVAAYNFGSGALSITVADVTGDSEAGIHARNGIGALPNTPLDQAGAVHLPLTLSTDLSITSTGIVTGDLFGIYAINYGSGALTIDTADVTGTEYVGILAVNLTAGTDLSITSSGTVSGGEDGIYALNFGTGALTINTNNVTGIGHDGIYAVNVNGTDMSISSTGTVTGDEDGVHALNYGSGSLTISVANVTGTDGHGIDAYSGYAGVLAGVLSAEGGSNSGDIHAPAPAANLSITATGTVTGGDDGIHAINYSTGALTIDANNVSGNGHDGIFAVNVYGTDLTISATGLVSGLEDGIHGLNYGSGALTISAVDVSATDDNGIDANNGYASVAIGSLTPGAQSNCGPVFAPRPVPTDLTIIATGTVSGGQTGIDARSFGTGAVTIKAVDVTGTASYGIYATNSTAGTNLSVTSTGHVSGYSTGILAANQGSGALTINADSVNSSASIAISASGGANGTDVSVNTTGLITSAGTGIHVNNTGTGTTTINADGDVDAGGIGIYAGNSAAGSSLTIDMTGDLSSGSHGVFAYHQGSGSLGINVDSVTSLSGTGVFARTSTTSTGFSLNATGHVSASGIGIYADNLGYGSTNLDLAAVTSAASDAVRVRSASTTTDVSVMATGSIAGAYDGVDVLSYGSGSLTVSVADVNGNGTYSYGITASLGSSGTDLTVTASGTVSGGQGGISVSNQGSGAVTITAGDVTGGTADGIRARTNYSGTGTDLTITTTDTVTGQDSGIDARNNGTGSLSINAVNATGDTAYGINAVQSAYGVNLSVTATGLVSGATGGIRTRNFGSGSTTVHAVDVTSAGGFGIYASRDSNGTSLSVTSTGTVSAYSHGIFALANGSGALSIETADVASSAGWGIFAQNVDGTNTSINTSGTVAGYSGGIRATHFATGTLTLSVASVMGTSGPGLYVYGSADTTGLSITATGSVSGASDGIYVRNFGTGETAINVAEVSGGTGNGLYARTGSAGSNLAITASGTVSGGTNGIYARNFGTGDLGINTADVSGAGGAGIHAYNGTNGSGLSISSTGVASGSVDGINAINLNSGAMSITAHDVNGASRAGINAIGSGGVMTISTSGTVTGGYMGISARNGSAYAAPDTDAMAAAALPGDMIITTTGTVYGGLAGIYALNSTGGGMFVTTSGQVSGGVAGIAVGNFAGDLTLDVGASVSGGEAGVIAVTYGGSQTVNINADIDGGGTGIQVSAAGGTQSLVINSDVTGGYVGVSVIADMGANIDVQAGASVSGSFAGIDIGSSGPASDDSVNVAGTVDGMIRTFAGNDTVTAVDSGTLNGVVFLGEGGDTLNLDGGAFTFARGGDGSDTVNFNASGGWIINSGAAGDVLAEFEIFNFLTGGYVLDGLHQGLTETNFLGGNNVLLGDLVSADVLIGSGAGLEVAHGASITGNLENAGRLGINGALLGEFAIDGDFTQTATGQITMNADPGSGVGDRLTVTGDVTLGGGLEIRQFGLFGASVTLIDGGTGLGGSFDWVTGLLEDGLLASQAIELDQANFDVNLITIYTDPGTIGGLTPNQISLAGGLTEQLGTGTGNQDFRRFGFTVASIDEVGLLGGTLDQLSPEVFDAGIQVVRNSQMMFMSQMMGQRPGTSQTPQPVQVASMSPEIPSGIVTDDRAEVWSSIRFVGAEQTGGGSFIDYESSGYEVAAGIADLKAGDIRFGLAVGYADMETDIDGPDLDRVSSDVFRLGLHASYDFNAGGSGLNSHLVAGIAVASGTNNVQMDVAIPTLGISRLQSAETDFDMFNAALRLTLDGSNGQDWMIKPFLLVSTDGYNQSGARTGSGTATALTIDGYSADRLSYGFGAMVQHEWSEASRVMLSATSLHHTGDTSSALVSDFAAPGLGTLNSFVINGRNIADQYLFEGELAHEYASGLTVSVQGYAQFGDLEGLGAQFRLARKF